MKALFALAIFVIFVVTTTDALSLTHEQEMELIKKELYKFDDQAEDDFVQDEVTTAQAAPEKKAEEVSETEFQKRRNNMLDKIKQEKEIETIDLEKMYFSHPTKQSN